MSAPTVTRRRLVPHSDRRRLWPWMETVLCYRCFRPKNFCDAYGCDT